MKVIGMGNLGLSDGMTGVLIEATKGELQQMSNLLYEENPMEASNIKAMREALLETKSVIAKCMDILNSIPDGVEYDGLIDDVADELCDLRDSHVNAALAAPPRNCDRPECATTKEAQDVWRKEDGGKTAYYEWLLATSTKGGAK